MKYLLTLALTFSAMANTTYICGIDDLDAKFTDESYLLIETTSEGKIDSIMTMPLRTSSYDEMTRLDNCVQSEFADLMYCSDSNRHNNTDSTYVKLEEGNKVLTWWGSIFSENYFIEYNCIQE